MFIKESIRKRGYYRALKSGKAWALSKKAMIDISNQMAAEMFSSMIKPNPFLKMIGLSEVVNIIPIKYGKDE